MADAPEDRAAAPSSGGPRSTHPALLVLTAVALLISIALLWKVWRQSNELEARLSDTARRAESLTENLEQSRQEAVRFKAESEAATAQAAETAELARQSRDARIRAELERELAREDAERAREEAARLQAETERMRKQREAELDRMQTALSHITETRRTPMGMVVNLGEDSFLFDFDKDTLRPENREMLSRIAGVLLASHGYRLQVYGHTDDTGPAAYNKDLSTRRARTVGSYLVTAGIPKEVVEVEGFGEVSPRIRSASSQARQKNRRVEIGVIDTIIHYTREVKEP